LRTFQPGVSGRFLGRKNANTMKIDFCHTLFVIQNALARITRKTQKITKVDSGGACWLGSIIAGGNELLGTPIYMFAL